MRENEVQTYLRYEHAVSTKCIAIEPWPKCWCRFTAHLMLFSSKLPSAVSECTRQGTTLKLYGVRAGITIIGSKLCQQQLFWCSFRRNRQERWSNFSSRLWCRSGSFMFYKCEYICSIIWKHEILERQRERAECVYFAHLLHNFRFRFVSLTLLSLRFWWTAHDAVDADIWQWFICHRSVGFDNHFSKQRNGSIRERKSSIDTDPTWHGPKLYSHFID